MDTSRDGNRTARTRSAMIDRLRPLAMIVIFDVAAPLAAYNLLRSQGMGTVPALLLSGVFPTAGIVIGAVRHRRLDVVGALVLAGILVGTVLGLVSHNARLILAESSVSTGIFAVGCLGSLWARRPLMYSMALEFIGPDTDKGRDMIMFWQHPGFRHAFRVVTAVWGVGFLLEAATRVVMVYNVSPGTALAISNVMPFIWVGVLMAWTLAYTTWQKKKTDRRTAAAGAAAAQETEADPSEAPAAALESQGRQR